MWLLITIPLALLSLRGSRRAYAAFMLFAIAFLPARAGFRLSEFSCETEVSVASAVFSLQNWKHVVLASLVAMMTAAQFRDRRALAAGTAVAVTVALGLVAEVEQGAFGQGHCRMRDLVPDLAGALLGAILVVSWQRFRRHRAEAE